MRRGSSPWNALARTPRTAADLEVAVRSIGLLRIFSWQTSRVGGIHGIRGILMISYSGYVNPWCSSIASSADQRSIHHLGAAFWPIFVGEDRIQGLHRLPDLEACVKREGCYGLGLIWVRVVTVRMTAERYCQTAARYCQTAKQCCQPEEEMLYTGI